MTSYAYVYLCHSALCFATYTPGIAMRNKVWAVLCTIYSYHLRQRATALAETTAVSLLLLWVSEYHCACCSKYEGTFRKITDEGPNILNFLSFVLLMPNEIERDSYYTLKVLLFSSAIPGLLQTGGWQLQHANQPHLDAKLSYRYLLIFTDYTQDLWWWPCSRKLLS